jgi:hypothetical protein
VSSKRKKATGPEAQRLKIVGDWQKAVGEVVKAKKAEPGKQKGAK